MNHFFLVCWSDTGQIWHVVDNGEKHEIKYWSIIDEGIVNTTGNTNYISGKL